MNFELKPFQRACRADLSPGQHTSVTVLGWDLLVANVDGTHYAIEDQCSHARARLSDGYLHGCQMICPLHGARFDVRNGTCLAPPADDDVRAFETRVREGYVEVHVEEQKNRSPSN